MTQTTINFDVPPCDPHVHPADMRRLAGQNLLVLNRLRRGPATNVDLASVCLRYSARVFDLNKAGYRITSKRLGRGLWQFTLEK